MTPTPARNRDSSKKSLRESLDVFLGKLDFPKNCQVFNLYPVTLKAPPQSFLLSRTLCDTLFTSYKLPGSCLETLKKGQNFMKNVKFFNLSLDPDKPP